MKRLSTLLLLCSFAISSIAQVFTKWDIYSGTAGSMPKNYCVYQKKLYFGTDNGTKRELMSTDGVSTTAIPGIKPGRSSHTAYNYYGVIFLNGDDGTKGEELYAYDGMGFTLKKDVYAGPNSSSPHDMNLFQGRIYFIATSNAGDQIWESDPTSGTTGLVSNIPSPLQPKIKEMIFFDNKFCYCLETNLGQKQFWIYDFLAGSTVADLKINDLDPANFAIVGNTLYFTATEYNSGKEIYSYDGKNPPVRLTDLNPGPRGGVIGGLASYNGKIYFEGSDGSNICKLYAFDPASSSTKTSVVHDFGSDTTNTISSYTVYNNNLYFIANDGTHGYELWMTNGTSTTMIADNDPGATDGAVANDMYVFDNALYFTGQETSTGPELYAYKDPAGIHDANKNDQVLSAFPNPGRGLITIQFPAGATNTESGLIVYDAVGKMIAMQGIKPGTTSTTVDMTKQPAGIYNAVWQTTGGLSSNIQLIIQ